MPLKSFMSVEAVVEAVVFLAAESAVDFAAAAANRD